MAVSTLLKVRRSVLVQVNHCFRSQVLMFTFWTATRYGTPWSFDVMMWASLQSAGNFCIQDSSQFSFPFDNQVTFRS